MVKATDPGSWCAQLGSGDKREVVVLLVFIYGPSMSQLLIILFVHADKGAKPG